MDTIIAVVATYAIAVMIAANLRLSPLAAEISRSSGLPSTIRFGFLLLTMLSAMVVSVLVVLLP